MRLDDFVREHPLVEMSYSRKKVESIITGLEAPINDHLLKLICFESEGETIDQTEHWAKEVTGWLVKIARLRIIPRDSTPKADFVFNVLYQEPFVPNETGKVAERLSDLAEKYRQRPDVDLDVAIRHLSRFLHDFAAACQAGMATKDWIGSRLDALRSATT